MASFAGRVKPHLLFAVSVAVPGLGHFLQKKHTRGAVFLGGTCILLGMGLALQGRLGAPPDLQLLSLLKFAGSLGTGVFFVAAKIAGLGAGNPSALTFDIGTAYIVTAGLMNYLAACHAFETAKGIRHA